MKRRSKRHHLSHGHPSASSVADLVLKDATTSDEASDDTDADEAAYHRAVKRRVQRANRRGEQLRRRRQNQPEKDDGRRPRGSSRLRPFSAVHRFGYCCEYTKSRGFRCNYTVREAVLSVCDPSHNEFYNCLTDLLPLLGFTAVPVLLAAVSWRPFTQAPLAVRSAFIATSAATSVQHAASLAAHTFCCVSPRLSHAIWFLDYCGILANFVWNAPLITVVAFPGGFGLRAGSADDGSLLVWFWLAFNAAVTPVIFGITIKIVCTYDPFANEEQQEAVTAGGGEDEDEDEKEGGEDEQAPSPKSLPWHHFLLGGSGTLKDAAGSVLLLLLVVPNLVATLAAGVRGAMGALLHGNNGHGDGSGGVSGGCGGGDGSGGVSGGCGDWRALLVLVLLAGGLVVKETRFPEAFFFRRKNRATTKGGGAGGSSDGEDEDESDDEDDEDGNGGAGGSSQGYGALDFSPLHSHVVWHIAVIILQGFYCAIYLRFMANISPPLSEEEMPSV